MAAIDLTRLKKQIEVLRVDFSDPAVFRARLHETLQFYHRHAYRQHKDAVPVSFMLLYDLPEQVLAQIAHGLNLRARQDTHETLAVVDELWLDDHFEARDLASHLLGQIPLTAKDEVYSRLERWLAAPLDRAVVNSLFCKANQHLLSEDSENWSQFLNKLLGSSDERLQNSGLSGLAYLVEQSHSNQLPKFYRWIRPFLQSDQTSIQPNLSRVVGALARRSPAETTYFLKEVLADTDGSAIESRVRSYLPFFDEEAAKGLMTSIRRHQQRTQLGL